MALVSASECTATVAMPISLQARWMRSAISPRLAMRTLSNMALLENDQRFAEFDGLSVVDQHLQHDAGARRGDGVHGLHGFHDQQGLAGADLVADLHERGVARLGLE